MPAQLGPAAAGAPRNTLQVAMERLQAGRLAEAESLLRDLLAVDGQNAEALHLLAAVLHQAGRHEAALGLAQQALALAQSPVYWNTLGGIQNALKLREEAAASFQHAIDRAPNFAIAHNNLGLALHRLWKFAEAETALRRAIALAPAYAAAHLNLAKLLLDLARHDEAAASFRAAIEHGLGDRATRILLARALMRAGRFDAAADALGKVLAINPGDREARELLNECRYFTCDWREYEAFAAEYRQRVEAGVRVFAYENMFPAGVPGLTRAAHLVLSRAAAERYARLAGPAPARSFARAAKSMLRIGYISGDYRQHPVANLTAELFELHDRRRFEVFGYSVGPDDASPLRQRIARAFDRFTDLNQMTYGAAADRIVADGVDILVDLSGYTQFSAPPVLALRPAPIQVSFLGYPATMGADFVDYIVADRFILPPEHAADYTEAPAYLPHCYMPSDRTRAIAPAPTRAAVGLPDGAFVFVCFNSVWKITPEVFRLWMELLRAVPGSVLWLRDTNALATRNLSAAAAAEGLAERLVFAGRADSPDHLARLGLADLFLDTLPYNAHSTASDALWAGVPVLTCVGDTFASRVCGSLLTAAGLPELITGSLAEYRDLALRLARDPAVLRSLRERLAANRLACPLFDSARFTRDLEALYRRMWERHVAGEKPAMLDLAEG